MSSLTVGARLVINLMFVVVLIAFISQTNCAGVKSFHYRGVNGSDFRISFPWEQIGDCVYDSSRDVITCMRNHPYDVIVSNWRNSPKNVSYISVNCLKQRIYRSNHQQCICKNRQMAAHPHKQTQTDSYEYCQLEAVYPDMWNHFENLEVLDLSHNHLFRLPVDSFRDLKKLRYLSLSNNQIRIFFDGLLCDVPKLEILLLQDMPLNSFPENLFQCGDDSDSSLEFLDLSRSQISSLVRGNFENLQNLAMLDMSYNKIFEWPENDVFEGLSSLETLDLSGNSFLTLPGYLCQHLTNLQRIFLRSNRLKEFDCSVFESCSKLEVLDLSHGSLASIRNSTCQITSLLNLDMSDNNLPRIPQKILHSFSKIKSLDLSQNSIASIHGESFHYMEDLMRLNLSYNKLKSIDESFKNSTADLTELEVLDLHANDIENIEQRALGNLKHISKLDLSENNLHSIDTFTFYELPLVKELLLQNNSLTNIGFGTFSEMKGLESLDISYNNVDNVDAGLPNSVRVLNLKHNKVASLLGIENLINLEKLVLKGNRLTALSDDAFKQLTQLRVLDLSENNLTSFDERSFSFLDRLESLDLSRNNLSLNFSKYIFYRVISLKTLDLSSNNISSIDDIFDGQLTSLEHLDLSSNSITSISAPLNKRNVTVYLKKLNLQNNSIRFISSNAFSDLQFLEHVNLQGNVLTSVPLFKARLGAMFFFKENPLVCSCDMVWILKRWLDTKTAEKMSTYDYDVDVCLTYPSMTSRQVRKLSDNNFLCPVEKPCPKLCQCFKLDPKGSIYMTVCRDNLTQIPGALPVDSEIIYLDGNNFEVVETVSITHLYTEKLYLNSSSIETFGQRPFIHLKHVSHLDISFNKLRYLPRTVFEGLDNIRVINIRNNLLGHLEKGLLALVPSLQNIDISDNKLHFIASETLQELDNLDQFRWIHLAGNPLLCVCENYEFRKWMERSFNRVYDRRKVLCNGEEIRRVKEDMFLCHESFPTTIKLTIIIVCVVAVLVPVIGILIYCRKEVMAICYTRVIPLFAGKQEEHHHHHSNPYLYDAVVLYDTTDPKCAWWVQKSLLPKLTEGRRKYKLYIPQPHSESTDDTLYSIQKSRCTLALVTNTFPQNRFALDCFRHSATQEVNVDNDHHVIIMTWGYLDKRNVPSYLKYFLDHREILPVTTSLFWDKLIKKLPDTLNRRTGQSVSRSQNNEACQSEEHCF